MHDPRRLWPGGGVAEKAHTANLVDCAHAFKSLAFLQLGRHAEAAEAARAGLEMAQARGLKLGRALCTEALGHVALAQGEIVASPFLIYPR